MEINLESAKSVAAIAAPLSSAIIETWLKPKLTELIHRRKRDKALIQNAFASKFDEYLIRSYEKQSYMNILVFQNQQKRLKEIYFPLNVKLSHFDIFIKMNSYSNSFVPTYKKILITDTVGVGKSTIMKFLFLSAIDENRGIPIFIELRKLSSDNSILDFIYNELNPIDDEFDKDFILKLIRRGDFIFFLDGFDEIPFSQRESVTRNLHDFISKAGENHFLLTSRPETSLAAFPDFQQFNP